MSVKINSLEFENVKRIKAVQLEPSKSGLTIIGGKNRQQTARQKKLRKLVLKVTEIFGWIMFGLISTGLIVCVIAGAMFLSGGLS